jgi:8-hydroxy-5-deazaflavin:NADPH oxidoreductase
MVGLSIASKLVEVGHDVMMGSRSPDNETAAEWVASIGKRASQGTFADAAAHGELLFNCTGGLVSVDAIGSARREDLAGKTLVDVANALDRSSGSPAVQVSPTDSLAERIQREFPETRVVKALNTMNHLVMVDPARVPGEHVVFVCGDDDSAKAEVGELLESFGWPRERIVDLGDLSAARGTEAYVALWVRLWGVMGTGDFNIGVLRPQSG